jgi:hypothetical protein
MNYTAKYDSVYLECSKSVSLLYCLPSMPQWRQGLLVKVCQARQEQAHRRWSKERDSPSPAFSLCKM